MKSDPKLFDEIMSRCLDEADFRNALLSDPGATLRAAFGDAVPAGAQVHALELSSSKQFVIIPSEAADLGNDDMSKLLRTALSDDAVMHDLIADPRASLAKHGIRMQAGVDVEVVRQGSNDLHVLVPAAAMAMGELSDDALEAVSGGLARAGNCGSTYTTRGHVSLTCATRPYGGWGW